MKKFFLGVFAIAGLVACVQTEEVNVPNPADNQIALSGYVGSSVRGAEDPSTKVQNLNHFTVWAYVGDSAGEVFNNELVLKSGSEWTYDKPRYWMEGYDYRFFAITPYGNGVGNVEVVNNPMTEAHNPFANGLGQINFTNIDGTEDVLYASCTKPAAAAIPEKVTFNFNHILSKVKFTFTNGYDDEKTTLKIKEVKMVVPAKGHVTLNPANLLDTPAAERVKYNWELDGTETLTLSFGDVDSAKNLAYGAVKEVDNERLTIPALDTQEYKITFKVEIWNGNAMNEKEIEASLTDYEFVSGTAYNLVATITPDALDAQKIEFDAKIIDWYKPTPEDHEIGYYKTADGNTYVVTSNDGLKKIADEINAGVDTDRNIVLSEDIDLSAQRSLVSNWTPIGSEEKPFTGTFDGKSFTIKNLVLAPDESANWYVGFFGYAKNATIKNVVFENVNVLVGGDDTNEGGHIAAVVGALEGTSTIENVTVKGNVYVEADVTKNNASRVAAVVGGNGYGNVAVKNVHVIANEGSYVKANNCVGAIAGQLNWWASFENCSSNIDVTGTKFFAGGIIGVAPTQATFVNCHTTGDVAITAGRSGKAHDHYRVGGIAGGWDDNTSYPCVLTNCSYTGNISGKNSDGTVADPLDYMGYVGRGYTLTNCAGSKVIIDGTEFVQKYDNVYGVYTINGCTPVATADELIAALAAGEGVYFLNDITVTAADGGYSKAGILQNKAQTIDGAGHTLTVKGAGGTWDCGIYTNGGLIKNLTVAGSFRGIFTAGQSSDVHIENVTFKNVVYTFNSDGTMPANPFGVYVSNSKVNGWTSHSNMHTEVVYTNCSFGEGSGYAFCRAYGYTVYEGCSFSQDFELDTKSSKSLVFKGCTHNGVEITAENALTLGGVDKNGNEVVFLYNGIGNLTIE